MVEGFLRIPATTTYKFTQYSDDSGFFAMAKNPTTDFKVPAWNDMRVLVQETGYCGLRYGPEIKGLKKGEAYYIRGWYKEGGGGDYGYWGWNYKSKVGSGNRNMIPLDNMIDR